MALEKEIVLESGIPVNYHRVVSLNKITNISNIIEIASYVSKEKREEEKQALIEAKKTDEYKETNIFIHTQYIESEYDDNINIENVYGFLKTLEQFKDAKDE